MNRTITAQDHRGKADGNPAPSARCRANSGEGKSRDVLCDSLITVAGLEPAASQLEVDNPLPPARFGRNLERDWPKPVLYPFELHRYVVQQPNFQKIKRANFGMGVSLARESGLILS